MTLNHQIHVFILFLYGCTSIFAAQPQDIPYDGLPNDGNTCWLNAATQFLHHAFNSMPAQLRYEDIFRYGDAEGLNGMPKGNYQYFYKLFLGWKAGEMPIENCAQKLSEYAPNGFAFGRQNDATDYINNVFTGFSERIDGVRQIKQETESVPKFADIYKVDEQTEIRCCRTKTDKHVASDPDQAKQENPTKKPYIELETLQEHQGQDEKMAGVIASLGIVDTVQDFFCHQCKQKVNIEKIKRFNNLPEILAMRAKVWKERSNAGEKYKINHYCVPLNIDFAHFATEKLRTSGRQLQYDLIGFTAHRGSSIAGGHWVAVLSHNDQWVKYDDCTVTCGIASAYVSKQLHSGQFEGFTPVSLLYRHERVRGCFKNHPTAQTAMNLQTSDQSSFEASTPSLAYKIKSFFHNPYGRLIRGALGLGALYYAYQRPASCYARVSKYLGVLSLVSSFYSGKRYFASCVAN